ncbi:response regulator [Candidatus Saccharibacteria bacterium]|nr:response regulator [Candidatus Saccharibacteria bacterium]
MSKIMVVEDDASLREIYSIRITAEGYEVVSAGDGEEALAMAVREKPDLILSDVMMPKISGFDMLDILRSTPETAKIKVVMMTALSADDQRARGERLGADRYLVKSQVGIEDVINTIHEVLGDKPAQAPAPAAPTPASATPAPAAPAPAAPASTVSTPVVPAPGLNVDLAASSPQTESQPQVTNEQSTANPAQ